MRANLPDARDPAVLEEWEPRDSIPQLERPRRVERARHGVLHGEQVVPVHDLAVDPVPRGAVGKILDRALRPPPGGEGELVVLADEDDGELAALHVARCYWPTGCRKRERRKTCCWTVESHS